MFPPLEFHLSRQARDQYRFVRELAPGGRPGVSAVHDLTLRMNQQARFARPGDLFALVLLHQVFHRAVEHYCRRIEPRLFQRISERLSGDLGSGLERLFIDFANAFPPLAVYSGTTSVSEFLLSTEQGLAGPDRVAEQMLFVFINNRNPACGTLQELFDERTLSDRDRYVRSVAVVREVLRELPPMGKMGLTLLDLLESPIKASPDSLAGQLQFIAANWDVPLDPELQRLLLVAQDLIREDEARRTRGTGATPIPDFSDSSSENLPERYSADADWMPHVVLMAKSVHVWLDQLSKTYGREIRRLDQIPDEEFAKLAGWGFTALWLIGLWERSRASQKIKQIHGNIDALASAYAVYEYVIAGDLGGAAALDILRERAWRHGIRLACDVVPNHMGIDSRWVVEHPDWFIQTDHPPYPDYHFTGPDLSSDPRVSLRIEDGYWNQTNAAVVFERRDNWTGQVRYIYHGNDGTSTPWNDTAQLNFLLPEVRAAVRQLILDVARRFSLIRFDAAMTLTRMHYQRLWYPAPGEGGAIPSRAWFGMSRAEFQRRMPEEFWREVVDRVNSEAPDTLLLAEAFWLTEGLFVRTLGMHRVYNSAFMNMLKAEDNSKYRQLIRNVLAYDARILERYVNFMSNPDEATALEQFGKDDKYFGVATLLATLPGLPMFGHGQIEGFAEKYGHEYRRAYYEEAADPAFIERHEREIFPILRRRHLFARADRFAWHDFVTPEGNGNDDIFAYSNRTGDTHTLVVYHNRFAETRGWIRDTHDHRSLADQLALSGRGNAYVIFRDMVTGLEYLRSAEGLRSEGLFVELQAFKYHVFADFRQLEDADGLYRQVGERLGGRGTPSVEREVRRIVYAPVTTAFAEFASAEAFEKLFEAGQTVPVRAKEYAQRSLGFLERARKFANATRPPEEAAKAIETAASGALHYLQTQRPVANALDVYSERRVLAGWLAVSQIGHLGDSTVPGSESARWMDEWFLGEILAERFVGFGANWEQAEREVLLVQALAAHQNLADTFSAGRQFDGVVRMLEDSAVRHLLHVHAYHGVEWYRAEAWQELLQWLDVIETINMRAGLSHAPRGEVTQRAFKLLAELAAVSEYDLGRFRQLLSYIARPAPIKTVT